MCKKLKKKEKGKSTKSEELMNEFDKNLMKALSYKPKIE